eukprot:1923457-Pleurochrysis_carterae.AAC.1
MLACASGTWHARPAAASQLGTACSSNASGDGPREAREWRDYAGGAEVRADAYAPPRVHVEALR